MEISLENQYVELKELQQVSQAIKQGKQLNNEAQSNSLKHFYYVCNSFYPWSMIASFSHPETGVDICKQLLVSGRCTLD